MKKGLIIIILISIALGNTATKWATSRIMCPVCHKINKFQEILSYGSYIYQWPSKLEFIFWPLTDSYCLYTCSKCKYSAFMWDFKDIGNDTLKLIKKEIANLNLSVIDYNDKMVNKLEASEKIYKLYEHNPDFWCKFYRTMGYHYNVAGEVEKAKSARLKALSIADSLIKLPENDYRKKELLLITSSMKYFTNQYEASINDINIALTIKFNDTKVDSAKNANVNKYIDEVLNELKTKTTNNK